MINTHLSLRQTDPNAPHPLDTYSHFANTSNQKTWNKQQHLAHHLSCAVQKRGHELLSLMLTLSSDD